MNFYLLGEYMNIKLVKNFETSEVEQLRSAIEKQSNNLKTSLDILHNKLASLGVKRSLSEFHHVIAEKRKTKKLTAIDVSELAGLNPNTYRSIESGASKPKLSTMLAIADVLGIKLWVE